jgi:hypothetical protein
LRKLLRERLDEIAVAADWINQWCTVKGIDTTLDSTELAMRVAVWARERYGIRPRYISNGAFIAAAIGLGIRYHLRVPGPGAWFGIALSRASWEKKRRWLEARALVERADGVGEPIQKSQANGGRPPQPSKGSG